MIRPIDDLARAYALLPEIACKGLCQEACGPIGMTEREYERMRRKGGHRTTTTADLDCPYLNAEGRCDVYAVRPMVCRAWGGVEGMECPWGCAPVIMPRDALVPDRRTRRGHARRAHGADQRVAGGKRTDGNHRAQRRAHVARAGVRAADADLMLARATPVVRGAAINLPRHVVTRASGTILVPTRGAV